MSFRRKANFSLTKKKKVIKNVGEHYLRDDIWCGTPVCKQCVQETTPLEHDAVYLIPDLESMMSQPDFFQHSKIKNVIICQSVLTDARTQSEFYFHRIREMIADSERFFYVFYNEHHRATYVPKLPNETDNERCHRAVRKAVSWYKQHLNGVGKVLMITNTKESKDKALSEGIPTQTVFEYARTLGDTELLDLLAGDEDGFDAIESDEVPPGQVAYFPTYYSPEKVKEGLRNKTLYEGSLRQNPDNYYEATVTSDVLDKDILIVGHEARNRALGGDRVAILLLPESEWQSPSDLFIDIDNPFNVEVGSSEKDAPQKATTTNNKQANNNNDNTEKSPTGIVVAVIKRNSFRKYTGSIDPDTYSKIKVEGNNNNEEEEVELLFDALDLRLPKIKVRARQASQLLRKRIVIGIDSWPRYSKHPIGHYVKTLGDIGDSNAESESLLIQHGISYEEFTPAVMACLPPEDWHVTDDDLLRRRDLRHIRIMSIDPPGCTDIDDALHVRELPNGNYEMGVHIADVSHFVQEATAIDREARKRGCTTYLVEKRIDMLPSALSTDICSLKPRVDRFAFSVVWELTPDANIVKTEFFKSIIKSVHAFTYAEAQARIDNKELDDDISKDLRNLNKLAKILRKRRLEVGALSLSSPQVKFKRDEENQDPIDVELYELRETNALVEEFMLLANIATAKEILKFFPSFALLRRHPAPKMKQFNALVDLVKSMGITLQIDTSKSLAESLDKAVKEGDPYFNELLRILTTRCMTPALYFSSGGKSQAEFYHYGLATPIYTHFTSPIRRFADVIVHRLLAASIGAAPLPSTLTHRNIQQTCENINRRHRMADIAGRDSTRLHTLKFFKGKTIVETARVLNVKSNGFSVIVPRYGIEGKVYLDETWNYKEDRRGIKSPDGKYKIDIFDEVRVEITLDDSRIHAPRVVYRCINPPVSKPSKITSSSSSSDSMLVDDPKDEKKVDIKHQQQKIKPETTTTTTTKTTTTGASKSKKRKSSKSQNNNNVPAKKQKNK
eukprot:TRINITY_DN1650_c0_g1_i1.p1 TRINITY_DN1650_c0_g1~~TRINITY_DN1650_c0_g1_i1.p1  ORF type:complete len:1014 (+),score=302.63 TRINITY_DN1650_c0_g1_i1:51-3092(+)